MANRSSLNKHGILLPATVLAFGCMWTACNKQPAGETSVSTAVTSNAAAPVVAAQKVDFEKVKGRWARTDGDYMLELKAMTDDGKVEAGYFNPSPINVAKASATNDAGSVKIFVELRDANYPGCIYNLTYIPDRDLLAGRYFQAAMQQTYDVVFERIKP